MAAERIFCELSDIPVGALGIGVVARTVSNDLWRFKVFVEEGRAAVEEQTAIGQPLEGPRAEYVPSSHVSSLDDLPSAIAGSSLRRSGRDARTQAPASFDENLQSVAFGEPADRFDR